MNPGRGNQESLLDVVAKGLNIAQSIYGIKLDQSKLDALDQERSDKAVKDMDLASEKSRLSSGRLNKGEQVEMGSKGLAEVPQTPRSGLRFVPSPPAKPRVAAPIPTPRLSNVSQV